MSMLKVYILESIDTTINWQNTFLLYGEQLLKEINDSISMSNNQNQISCELINISGKYQWQKAWRHICAECQQGILPMIHIIAHGKPNGIIIAGYKELQWRYVLQQFRKVNDLCGRRLRVTMNVCYAGRSLENLLTKRGLQFEFMLASPDKLPMNVFNSTNIAKHPFVIFYETMLTTSNIDKALKSFSKSLPSSHSNDHSKWYLIYAENTKPLNFSVNIIKE